MKVAVKDLGVNIDWNELFLENENLNEKKSFWQAFVARLKTNFSAK